MNGALLVHKHEGVSSFGIIELLQHYLMEKSSLKKRDLPKLGHGGTLDPFATGLLIVLVGRGVKLARYFLGSTKTYEGIMRFGETTIPGDFTAPISETSSHLPSSLNELQELAHRFTLQPYSQKPPMHSAKKKNGKPLYELARAGIEVDREPKFCHLYEYQMNSYETPRASFRLKCSSGTYVRTLTQDYAKILGTVAGLETLHRTASGIYGIEGAWSVQQITESTQPWDQLPCWISFDRLLDGYSRAEATPEERQALFQGKQSVLFNIVQRITPPQTKSDSENTDCITIFCEGSLIAIARKEQNLWGIERVFTND